MRQGLQRKGYPPKLDRLLDSQLDGSLSQTEYATKKHKLILAKKDFSKCDSWWKRGNRAQASLPVAGVVACLRQAGNRHSPASRERRGWIKTHANSFGPSPSRRAGWRPLHTPLAGEEGIGPSSLVLETSVLPLNYSPTSWP